MPASDDYLKLRGKTYYVRVQIPHHLWAAAGGRREFVKTLKTRDRDEPTPSRRDAKHVKWQK